MRKIIITSLALLLLCSTHASAMSVTFINPGKQGERFWDMVTETMQASADDLDITLEVIYAQRNRVKMRKLGLAVTQRTTLPDYLVLVNEEQAAEDILVAADSAGIKTLMLLNDFLPEQRHRIGQPGGKYPHLLGAITPDNFSAGARMMKALKNCAENNQRADSYHVLALGGDTRTPASIDRNNGALSVLEKDRKLILDRFLFANWNKQEAKDLTIRYLKWAERNQIAPAVIWAANDPIAAGAIEALREFNLQPGKDLCLVGLNWSTEGLQMVRDGELVLTDGGHFLAGAWSMVLLNDHYQRSLTGITEPIGHVPFNMQSIDKTLIKQYTHKLGDEDWSKIDFRSFSLVSSPSYRDYDFSLAAVFNNIRD
ncbi:MAG: ABC transporter substrate-binding protein [Amphritea sp.]